MWLQLLNTAGLIVVAMITYWGNRQIHLLVNSRMSELLELTRKAAIAQGVKEESERKKP
jgi:hypothetical protein